MTPSISSTEPSHEPGSTSKPAPQAGVVKEINVKVGDIVPNQVTVTGVSSSQFTCSHVGNTVSCTKPYDVSLHASLPS